MHRLLLTLIIFSHIYCKRTPTHVYTYPTDTTESVVHVYRSTKVSQKRFTDLYGKPEVVPVKVEIKYIQNPEDLWFCYWRSDKNTITNIKLDTVYINDENYIVLGGTDGFSDLHRYSVGRYKNKSEFTISDLEYSLDVEVEEVTTKDISKL